MTSFPRAFLLCIVSCTVIPAASKPENSLPKVAPTIFQTWTHTRQRPKALAKASASQLKHVGTMHYWHDPNTAEWVLLERDTMMYDIWGNLVLQKSTIAHSGWLSDSLTSLDSSVFIGTSQVEELQFHWNNFAIFGPIHDASRVTVSVTNDGKSLTYIGYSWNEAKSIWVASQKDSTVSSSPVSASHLCDPWARDYTKTIAQYEGGYDTMHVWVPLKTTLKIDTECTATMLVRNILQSNSATPDIKFFTLFNSSDWALSNIAEEILQIRDTATGKYRNVYRWVSTPNSSEQLRWNSSSNNWTCELGGFAYKDAHSNDTLSVSYSCPSGDDVKDTNGMMRLTHTYDSYGNDLEVITDQYDPGSKVWNTYLKDVYQFGQISLPVKQLAASPGRLGIYISISPSLIHAVANDITGLNLYKPSGSLVASVKQQPAPSVSLVLPHQLHIPSGAYIVEIACENGKRFVPVAIRR
jgi:hypothetical protein